MFWLWSMLCMNGHAFYILVFLMSTLLCGLPKILFHFSYTCSLYSLSMQYVGSFPMIFKEVEEVVVDCLKSKVFPAVVRKGGRQVVLLVDSNTVQVQPALDGCHSNVRHTLGTYHTHQCIPVTMMTTFIMQIWILRWPWSSDMCSQSFSLYKRIYVYIHTSNIRVRICHKESIHWL